MTIAENLASVRSRIVAAANRVGRDPEEITLVTVTKGFPVSRIVEAIESGANILGENRAKEAAEKYEVLGREVEDRSISWHFIGYLQTNKVRYVLGMADLIHSVDRVALAAEINKKAAAAGKKQSILVEVNISGEAAKAGINPDEMTELIETVRTMPNLELKGLMAMAPVVEQPEQARPYFKRLHGLFEIAKAGEPGVIDVLSMGMSDDFEVAIEEGATLIRVGRAIMGERPLGAG